MLSFIFKCIPNFREIILSSLFKASIEVWYEKEMKKYGDNPINKSLLRDIASVPGATISSYNKQELGKTGIKNDEITLAGTLLRSGCKASLLYLFDSNNSSDNKQFSYLAGTVNFICDPLSSLAYVVSKARQEEGQTHIDAVTYIISNIQLSWVTKVGLGSVVGSSFAHLAGEVVKYLDYSSLIKQAGYYIEDKIITNMLSIPEYNPALGSDMWSKIEEIHQVKHNQGTTLVDTALLTTRVVSTLTIELANTYVIATSARAAFAAFELLLVQDPYLVFTTTVAVLDEMVSKSSISVIGEEQVSELQTI